MYAYMSGEARPASVNTDQIGQVIQNLVPNADQAMQGGKGKGDDGRRTADRGRLTARGNGVAPGQT